jgi:hypothetical protein
VRQRKISHIRRRVPSLDNPLGLPFFQAAGHVGRDVEERVGLEEDGLHESLRSNARGTMRQLGARPHEIAASLNTPDPIRRRLARTRPLCA